MKKCSLIKMDLRKGKITLKEALTKAKSLNLNGQFLKELEDIPFLKSVVDIMEAEDNFSIDDLSTGPKPVPRRPPVGQQRPPVGQQRPPVGQPPADETSELDNDGDGSDGEYDDDGEGGFDLSTVKNGRPAVITTHRGTVIKADRIKVVHTPCGRQIMYIGIGKNVTSHKGNKYSSNVYKMPEFARRKFVFSGMNSEKPGQDPRFVSRTRVEGSYIKQWKFEKILTINPSSIMSIEQ